ncbi:hypothetical protein KAU43_06685 [candidate division WOR-3 bacterium]|nr:hypothetical protein [candidate division WOR-3 bacterium]
MKQLFYFLFLIVVAIIIMGFYNEISLSYPDIKIYQDSDVLSVKSSNIQEIKPRDTFISVDSVRYYNLHELNKDIEKFPIGSFHEYQFVSFKDNSHYIIILKHHRLSDMNMFSSRLILAILFIILSVIILSIKTINMQTTVAILFFILLSLVFSTYKVQFYNRFLYSILILSSSLVPGIYIVFLSTFPKRLKYISNIIFYFALILSIAVFITWLRAYFNFMDFLIPKNFNNLIESAKYSQIYLAISIITGMILIIIEYRRANNIEKLELKWFLIGEIAAFVPILFLFSIPFVIIGHELLNLSTLLIFVYAIPISITFGILKFRLKDVDFILIRVLSALAVSVFVIPLYILFVRVLPNALSISPLETIYGIYYTLSMIIIISFGLYIYHIFESLIYKTFFKNLYWKKEKIKRLIYILKASSKGEQIIPEILSQIRDAFNLNKITIEEKRNNIKVSDTVFHLKKNQYLYLIAKENVYMTTEDLNIINNLVDVIRLYISDKKEMG